MNKFRFSIASFLTLLLLSGITRAQQTPAYTRIAVMPFKNLTNNPDNSWVGEGIADTLTAELGTIQGLVLIERLQMAKIMEELHLSQTGLVEEKNAARVGKMVSAKYLIVGSYQIVDSQVMISARLLEIELGVTKETCRIRGEFKQIFDLQDELAKKTLEWLDLTPTTEEIQNMISTGPRRDITSFEYVSRAREDFYAGKTDDAMKWVEKALKQDPSDPETIMMQGRILYRRGKWQEALASFTTASEIFNKKKDKKNYAVALRWIGNVYGAKGKSAETMKYYVESFEIATAINDEKNLAALYNNIGLEHKIHERYDRALEYFQKSLKMKRKLGDERGVATTLINIGDAHYKKLEYNEASKCYEQSLEISRKIGYESGVALALYKIGKDYEGSGDFRDALKYYKESLEIYKKIDNAPKAALISMIIGERYYILNRYKKALYYFNESLEIRKGLNNELDVARALTEIGRCYMEMKKYSEARNAWEEALAIYKKKKRKKYIKKVEGYIKGLP